jgi:hypothetical protein
MEAMMKAVLKWLAVFFLGAASTVALAHHSFSATYDETKEVKIEGSVVQFMMRNPHSMLQVDVKGEDGTVHRYAIEWAGATGLSGEGITSKTIRVGDVVLVRGNPGRNKTEYRMRMLGIERPQDGWKWGGTYN